MKPFNHPRLVGLLLLSSFCYTTFATIGDCEPAIPGCQCDVGTLQCTEISEFPSAIPDGTTEFICESCKMDTITAVPEAYKGVDTFIYTNGETFSIEDGAFQNMAGLSMLKLSGNSISSVTSSMFNGLTELKTLELSNNKIGKLEDGVFESVSSLQVLRLDTNNGLEIEDGAFKGLDSLAILSLNKCGLSEVPTKAISKCSNLQTLILDQNSFANVKKDAFEKLNNLQKLTLISCGISEIEKDAFDELENLESLNLGDNKLKNLDEDLLNDCDKLEELSIANNLFESLPHDLVEWNKLKVVDIRGNQWKCDCEIVWMQELHVNTKDNITCSSPEEVKGHDLHNVTSSFTDCEGYRSKKSTIVMAVVIPLIIICVLLIGYYVYKIFQTKKRKGKKSVRYSAVYKDTVESVSGKSKSRPMSEM